MAAGCCWPLPPGRERLSQRKHSPPWPRSASFLTPLLVHTRIYVEVQTLRRRTITFSGHVWHFMSLSGFNKAPKKLIENVESRHVTDVGREILKPLKDVFCFNKTGVFTSSRGLWKGGLLLDQVIIWPPSESDTFGSAAPPASPSPSGVFFLCFRSSLFLCCVISM